MNDDDFANLAIDVAGYIRVKNWLRAPLYMGFLVRVIRYPETFQSKNVTMLLNQSITP